MSNHPLSQSWLQTQTGARALKLRAADASLALTKLDFTREVCDTVRAARHDLTAARTADTLLRQTLEEIQILSLAHHQGIPVPEKCWTTAESILVEIFACETLSCQGRGARPPWKADLSTADLGVALALIISLAPPLSLHRADFETFLREKCWNPAVQDWLNPATRIHSLDSMGHNWWSVIVGGAGVVAALLGWRTEARQAAEALTKWFRYPGNRSCRKEPNFGAEGDFLEGFGYCDYALIHPLTLSVLLPEFPATPQWLDPVQIQGLAAWYQLAFVRTRDGYWPKRFGDTSNQYKPKPCVWHTLAGITNDSSLLTLASKLVPVPRCTIDFLLWRTPTSAARATRPVSRIFPTSGCAFFEKGRLSISVRSGEFWNHNHLDAGSFIMAQDGTVWIDDAGTCRYSSPEYIRYYSTPAAHNITWAPSLIPPIAEAKELGLDMRGEFILQGKAPGLAFLQADTRLLSAGSLLRSRRSFFVLADEMLLIWDDLEARQPEQFETLLHTSREARSFQRRHARLMDGPSRACTVFCFSDTPVQPSIRSASMGEFPGTGGEPETLHGAELAWKTLSSHNRQKFLLAIGTDLQSGAWRELPSGWECRIRTKRGRWLLWFNRLADGRLAHSNTTEQWRGLETDAYALLIREGAAKSSLHACNASFVRQGRKVLHDSMRREALIHVPFSPP